MRVSVDTVGDVVSSFVYLDLWDQLLANVRPFSLPERLSLIRVKAERASCF